MKKIISLILAVAFILALVSCGGSAEKADTAANSADATEYTYEKLAKDENAGKYRAGFARTSITPTDFRLPMQGYGTTARRVASSILSYLYTQCIAVSDEKNNTLILVQNDLINFPGGAATLFNNIMSLISKKTGVPEDNIVMTQTHTHSAPALAETAMTSIQIYHKFLTNAIVNNCIKAMNDRAPVTGMYYGDVQVPDHNFVRHYWATDGEGDVRALGDNHWDVWYSDLTTPNKRIIEHSATLDQTFYMFKFTREGKDNGDLVWMSFRAHNTYTGSSSQAAAALQMSADWVGELVKYFEEAIPGSRCIYAQGDAGNVNPTSRMTEEFYYKDYKEYASTLNEYAVKLYGDLKEVPLGPVGGKRFDITLKVNHDTDSLFPQAKLVQTYWKKSGVTTDTKRYAYTLGLVSQYQANGIVARASAGKEITYTAQVWAIGKIGTSCTPGELFNQLGVKARSMNPFEIPLSISYTGVSCGYFADEAAYDYGCYETDTAKHGKGSSEQLVDELIKQLTELKKRLKG